MSGRISKSAVNQVLVDVGENLKKMAGPDGKLSRTDIKKGTAKIEDKVERDLTQTFAKFIDHRDAKSGAQITASDIDKAVEYSKKELVADYDSNNNGLDKTEISKMSKTGQLAARLAARNFDKADKAK